MTALEFLKTKGISKGVIHVKDVAALMDEYSALIRENLKTESLEAFIRSQPYYGYCTTEYCEGIEVGAKWQNEKDIALIDAYVDDVMGGFNGRFNDWLLLNRVL